MATDKKKTLYAEIERETIKGKDGKLFRSKQIISAEEQIKLVAQVNEEFNVAFKFNEAKRKTNLARLKLYNNQRRDSSAVGDPLMFTVFNTILASLYDDRLQSVFEGRGGIGDEDVEDNLNALANFDYDVMHKSEIDYAWDWDSLFYGRGLLLMLDFDRTKGIMSPIPEVLDAATWIRDPNAKSVNGDMRGRGGMRFGGREVGATYYELKKLKGYFNLLALNKDKEKDSLLDAVTEARDEAQGRENFSSRGEVLGKYNNYEFKLLDWFTTIKGKKFLITLGNNRQVLVRMIELPGNRWNIIDRPFYPMANDWDGVSVPDLTEDKQRARSVLLNIGLASAKADVTPSYLFDRTKIKNVNDLNFKINKFIGVDGSVKDAIAPIQKATAHQYVNIIMDILDEATQRAAATPEIQQGVQPSSQRTLGELELVSSKVDTRYSMTAKIWGWSERAFWRQWYFLYKKHFKNKIDEKVIRIAGALAPLWRPIKREDIIAEIDPDVKIESLALSEAKRLREDQSFSEFAQVALADPENNRRFIYKKMAKLKGMSREEIDVMFPKTVDELQAEDENERLNKKQLPEIKVTDDHKTHIEIHSKADQNPQSVAHIRAHKKMMLVKRDNPELFPPEQALGQEQQQGQGQGQQVTATEAPPLR